MSKSSTGAQFEIRVDGKTASHRDVLATALEAGKVFKLKHPQSDVEVRDIRDGSVTVIDDAMINSTGPAKKA